MNKETGIISLVSIIRPFQIDSLFLDLFFGKKKHNPRMAGQNKSGTNIFPLNILCVFFHFDTGKGRSEGTQNAQFILNGRQDKVCPALRFYSGP